MRCTRYNIGDRLPKYLEKDGFMIPCIPANFERLGILARANATPEAGKIITKSHGEIIDGEWREIIDEQLTQAEIETATKLARTTFTQLQIREAFKALNKEADLNTLLDGNAEFKTYWQEAQEIDLNHPVTVQALANFTAAEIEELKMEM